MIIGCSKVHTMVEDTLCSGRMDVCMLIDFHGCSFTVQYQMICLFYIRVTSDTA
jgi:hypothetical protein